jgi:hypothetical protein
MPLTADQRATLLAPLVANCECAETKAKLEALPDDDLMKAVAEKAKETKPAAPPTPTANAAAPVAKPLSDAEWLASRPRPTVRVGRPERDGRGARSQGPAGRTPDGERRGDAKAALTTRLKAKDLDELRDLAAIDPGPDAERLPADLRRRPAAPRTPRTTRTTSCRPSPSSSGEAAKA